MYHTLGSAQLGVCMRLHAAPKKWLKAACILSNWKQIAVDNWFHACSVLFMFSIYYIIFLFFLLQVEMYFC